MNFINNPGHITRMAAMPIYGKTPFKIYLIFINHDPVVTLTYFTAIPTEVSYAF